MIVRVTLKDPDGFHESIKEAINESRPDGLTESEWDMLAESRRENISLPFVSYGEYVTIDFDTEKRTAIVVENAMSPEQLQTLKENCDRIIEQQEERVAAKRASEQIIECITKRDRFAAMAMQGLSASNDYSGEAATRIARYAVEQADALIAELNKAP